MKVSICDEKYLCPVLMTSGTSKKGVLWQPIFFFSTHTILWKFMKMLTWMWCIYCVGSKTAYKNNCESLIKIVLNFDYCRLTMKVTDEERADRLTTFHSRHRFRSRRSYFIVHNVDISISLDVSPTSWAPYTVGASTERESYWPSSTCTLSSPSRISTRWTA